MKPDLKSAIITYLIWTFMSYLLMSFYACDFNSSNWNHNHRFILALFGPIFGVFVFLSVAFWREAFKEEENLENE